MNFFGVIADSYVAEGGGGGDASVIEHVSGAVAGSLSTTYTISLTETPQAGDVVVLRVTHHRATRTMTGASGLGATWSQVAFTSETPEKYAQVWLGTGATSSGVVTATFDGSTWAQASLTLVRGLASTAVTYATADGSASGANTGPALNAAGGQFVVATCYAGLMTAFPSASAPVSGWSADTILSEPVGFELGHAYRVPTGSATSHRCDLNNSGSTTGRSLIAVIGDAS